MGMNFVRNFACTAIMILVGSATIFISTSCSTSHPVGVVGNFGTYNYSPSVIQTGNIRQIWWCSQGVNPSDSKQDTDAIYFESINLSTHESFGPVLVLAETPGAWDSVYTCNPKVIGGVFENPLGDGQTYSFAMYYVATANPGGVDNSIGVAFSNDGIVWKKYPRPVIMSTSPTLYGVGQPSLYNADHKAAISMFYEDVSFSTIKHRSAVSTDGVHFTLQGTLTSNGLDPDDPQPIWGDMSYEPTEGAWYAVFCRPIRPPSTTGGILEHGQYGVELYKIPQAALLTGTSPWQQLVTIDTNSTGFESNFIAGLVHDSYGNIDLTADPNINMYVSTSYPQTAWDATPAEAGTSAAIQTWILVPVSWSPGATAAIPFNRYFNGTVHEVTTGWVDPGGGFQLQGVVGSLYQSPVHGATVPFYGCKATQTDYFVSLDIGCEGQRALGKQGYGYSQPVSGLNLVAIYRCSTGFDHFISQDPKCEGQTTDELLGYVVAP
jgi:hypothetical protein